MLRRPDVDEVMEYGRALGFELTPTEARMIQARMMDTIAALEAFDEMRVEERGLPLRFTDRDPGRRPTEAEDPLGAFIRTCRVKGADRGPLAGKTVALKDHIALAGVPLTLTLVARSMSRWMVAATLGSDWSRFHRSTSSPISRAYRSRVSASSWGLAKSRSCISQ